MKYLIEQYPKFKDFDNSRLSEYQIYIRRNQKKHKYGKTKVCTKCHKKLAIEEFYVKDKNTGRRSNCCRDCQMKESGVLEIGKCRFSDKIMKKGFRRCSVCKEIKPLTEFSKQKNVYGEHSRLCLKCSHKLHKEYLQKQNKEVGDFYVRQYGLRKGITEFNPEIIEGLRDEIIESRKPKYFFDNKNVCRFAVV